ncbi:glycosyltransferase [Clostridium neuense]|uniref:Glycosyltransferase n=1 Tax=Clostridium neuense TaxID=1728934 RepID=A0ABW8TIN1_9CLOT
MKISLCMIVKNEEKYIKMCLENAMKLADEAVIVDTGSTDKTKEIIKDFDKNIKIIDYKWDDDFSKARNVSIENATGDWILMMDADEKLLCNPDKVRKILEKPEFEGYKVPLYNITNANMIIFSSVYTKLFKNNKEYRYSGRIHEQLNIPNLGDTKAEMPKEISKIIHYGYLDSVVKERDKAGRNLRILKKQLKEMPNDPFVHYNIGVSYQVQGKNEEALKHFFKCNELWRKKDLYGVTLYEIDMTKRIAESLVKLGKYDECIDMLKNILNDDVYKGFVDLEYIEGMCYYFKKDYKKAVSCFEKCTEMGDTNKFISVLGMGSYKAKEMMARCYVELKDELKAINAFMESIFDPNNFMHEGLNDFRIYLKKNNRIEILNQLNKLVSNNN